jgi:hypothetical protein
VLTEFGEVAFRRVPRLHLDYKSTNNNKPRVPMLNHNPHVPTSLEIQVGKLVGRVGCQAGGLEEFVVGFGERVHSVGVTLQ